MIPITGPNDSSVITRIEWSTSTSTVGPKYGVPAAARSKSDSPTSARAPCGDRLGDLLADAVGGARR